MNFCKQVKAEILNDKFRSFNSKKAILNAMLMAGGKYLNGQYVFKCKDEKINEVVFEILKQITSNYEYDANKKIYNFKDKNLLNKLLYDESADSEKFFPNALKGLFLVSGSVTILKSYHVEFGFYDEKLAESLVLGLKNNIQINAKVIKRNKKSIVYVKGLDGVCDILAHLGANNAVLQLHNEAAHRDANSEVNRIINAEIANQKKADRKSEKQIEIINELKRLNLLDNLPDKLKQAAEVRLNFPSDSIAALAEKLDISKSCLVHRLNKLEEYLMEVRS